MSSNRRITRRLYFFEILAAVNLAVVLIFLWESRSFAGSLPDRFVRVTFSLLLQAAAGVLVRSIVALIRRDRGYFRVIRSAGWLTDTLRIALFGGISTFAYGWIKLVVPLYHPRLFDQELWNLDQALFGGYSPNILFLHLFSSPPALQTISATYASVFFISMLVAIAYILSDPSRRLRIAFVNGNITMWIAGAWLYMLVPSLGPAYRFPDVWMAYDSWMKRTIDLQAMLMRNYVAVNRAAQGLPSGPISLLYGIAAFPSMHVAWQMFAFLWFRRIRAAGRVLFGVFVLLIFVGSVVTGWHYLVDSLAGLLLAFVCYKIPFRAAKTGRFLAIKRSQ